MGDSVEGRGQGYRLIAMPGGSKMYATYECEIRGKKKRGTFTFIRGKGEYKGVMGIGAFASKLDTETLLCDIIEG